MTLHLDTHIVVWLYEGKRERFTPRALAALDHSKLVISPMVELELVYLWESQRITEKPTTIIEYLTPRIGLFRDDSPFASVVALAAGLLWTRDPFDRIITAGADSSDCPLLTKDRTIRAHYRNAVWDDT